MTIIPRPCLGGCGRLTVRRRCFACECEYQRIRNARPERAAYRDPAYRNAARGGLCHICGEPGADTLDHVIPLIAHGPNTPDNWKPAHRSCNSSKGGHL